MFELNNNGVLLILMFLKIATMYNDNYYFFTCFGIIPQWPPSDYTTHFAPHVQSVSCTNVCGPCRLEPMNKGHIMGQGVLRVVSFIRRLKCTDIIGIGTSRFVLYREVFFIRSVLY